MVAAISAAKIFMISRSVGDFATFLLERYAKHKPINLFQGPYAVVNKKTGSRKDLTMLAKLAAVWVVIYIAGLGIQGMWSSYQAEQLATDNRNRYVELFPQDSVPITAAQLRRRFEGKLRRHGQPVSYGTMSFVHLLGHAQYSVPRAAFSHCPIYKIKRK